MNNQPTMGVYKHPHNGQEILHVVFPPASTVNDANLQDCVIVSTGDLFFKGNTVLKNVIFANLGDVIIDQLSDKSHSIEFSSSVSKVYLTADELKQIDFNNKDQVILREIGMFQSSTVKFANENGIIKIQSYFPNCESYGSTEVRHTIKIFHHKIKGKVVAYILDAQGMLKNLGGTIKEVNRKAELYCFDQSLMDIVNSL